MRVLHALGFSTLLVIAALSLLAIGLNNLVIQSVTFHSVGKNEPAIPIPSPYIRVSGEAQEIKVQLYYRGYGNTTLRLTPLYCFGDEFRLNEESHPFPKENHCRPLNIDLAPWLRPGNNTLAVTIDYPGKMGQPQFENLRGFSIGSPLFTNHLTQNGFTLLFLISISILLWLLLIKNAFSPGAALIFVSSCLIYLCRLYKISDFFYTTDLNGHIKYIQFVSEHFFQPADYTDWESWQPPSYYWLCAIIAKTLGALGVFNVWTAIRSLSVLSYGFFLYFGGRALSYKLRGRTFLLAFAMLAFWPAGIRFATRINNDVLAYPFYAACFYYTLVWYDTLDTRLLTKAIISSAIGFMVKGTAFIPTTILASTVLLVLATKRCTFSNFFQKKLWLGYAVFLGGVLFNLRKYIYYLIWGTPFHSFLAIRGDFQFNFSTSLREWYFATDSVLFNRDTFLEFHPAIPLSVITFSIYLFYLGMLSYIFLIGLRKNTCSTTFPIRAGFIIPFLASFTFLWLARIYSCIDFRYIYPALIAVILVFFIALEKCKNMHWLLYYSGVTIACCFVALSLIFIGLQFV